MADNPPTPVNELEDGKRSRSVSEKAATESFTITTPPLDDASIYIDPDLERRTLRKFDKYLLPQFFIILLIAYLDRSNIGNAKVFGFEEGIGLTGTQFNNVSTLFYPTYIVFETPWVMAVKYFGANKVLAVAMVSWSAVTLGTGFIRDYHEAIVVRLLLGFFEAGLVPGLVFIMSTIWSRESQSKRVALIYGCNCLSGAFGGRFWTLSYCPGCYDRLSVSVFEIPDKNTGIETHRRCVIFEKHVNHLKHCGSYMVVLMAHVFLPNLCLYACQSSSSCQSSISSHLTLLQATALSILTTVIWVLMWKES